MKKTISQKSFDRKMEAMGYECTPTGGGCEGYAKPVALFVILLSEAP